jgi:hypothetical protein
MPRISAPEHQLELAKPGLAKASLASPFPAMPSISYSIEHKPELAKSSRAMTGPALPSQAFPAQ